MRKKERKKERKKKRMKERMDGWMNELINEEPMNVGIGCRRETDERTSEFLGEAT